MKTYRRSQGPYFKPSVGRPMTKPVAGSPSGIVPAHEMIAKRAHQKWLARGNRNDTGLQDWLEAEAELKTELSQDIRI